MGSPHTLDPPTGPPEATDPQRAQRAAFDQLNPDVAPTAHDDPAWFAIVTRHLEEDAALGERVAHALNMGENHRPARRVGEVPDPDRVRANRLAAVTWRARDAQRAAHQRAEATFDRLNPGFGAPADAYNPLGQKAVRDREAALALGPRVAVATSRENDRDPVVWLGGQDYRAAQAIQAARRQPARVRWGPERAGAER